MKLKFISIRKKLQLIVAAATLTALLFSLIGNVVGDVWVYHRAVTKDLSAQAESLMDNAVTALRSGGPTILARDFRELKSSVRAAAVYDQQGQLFASYVKPGSGVVLPAQPGTSSLRFAGAERILVQPVMLMGRPIGQVYLSAEYDLAQTIVEDLEIALLVSVLAMAIALLLIGRLEKMVTGPIIAVAAVVRSVVEEEDYSRRVQRSGNDEVGVLVDSFNDMLAVVQRRTAQREQAQAEVMHLNAALEIRVIERTMQLEDANGKLELAKAAADEARTGAEHARAVAEDANDAKSAFLSSMSHELRTPLNSILGFAQLLSSDAHAEEHRQEFAGYILKGGHHLLTLINEVLDLAKVESGAVMLSMEPVSVADVMRDCRAMIEPLAGSRRIAIAFPEQSDTMVQADRTRLKQVMLNLLSNAIKYNREEGSVLVECRPASGGQVRITVRDSGHGLSGAQQRALFQPFNRLGQEGGSEDGTGIGLVVTKRLVELMDGTIGVRSTVGMGSEFWIELAAATAPPAAQPADAAAAQAAATVRRAAPTLLYVEDNPANLKLVETMVRLNPDVRLLSAPDAHLGIQLARAHMPDVILMDINLPGMSGADALKLLRADSATAHIPVIAVTAGTAPREAAAGANGFVRYLAKPLDVNEFWHAIRAALAATPGEKA